VRVGIAGTAALSAFGACTQGLGQALRDGAVLPGLPAETPLANPKARKMMAPAAYLAARCLADLLATTAWSERDQIGMYLGVGASAGSLADFTALLGESLVDGAYSLARFGHRGLAACNPLLAFQLMNNFTLCHGAILEGVGGPNSALFSRGAGTVSAIGEAVYAVASGECERAITGGADAPTHPATIAELARDGVHAPVSDGAGLIALEASDTGTRIVHCATASGRGRPIADALAEITRGIEPELVVVSGWPDDHALRTHAARYAVPVIASDGSSLAAGPALAVIAAAERRGRTLVLTLGVDGDPGAIVLEAG
jgi:hypothetical protein